MSDRATAQHDGVISNQRVSSQNYPSSRSWRHLGVALVLALVGMAVIVSVAGVLLLYLVASRGPAVPEQAALVLRPGGDLLEVLPDDVVGQFIGGDASTVRGFVDSLRMAKRDPRRAPRSFVRLKTPPWSLSPRACLRRRESDRLA